MRESGLRRTLCLQALGRYFGLPYGHGRMTKLDGEMAGFHTRLGEAFIWKEEPKFKWFMIKHSSTLRQSSNFVINTVPTGCYTISPTYYSKKYILHLPMLVRSAPRRFLFCLQHKAS